MSKVNKLLLMLIAMVTIMIVAVGIDKGTEYLEARRWEKERVQRYEEAQAQVSDIQVTISELSKDQEAIEEFIAENKEYFEAVEFSESEEMHSDLGAEYTEGTDVPEKTLSENNVAETLSGNTANEGADESMESEDDVSENTVSVPAWAESEPEHTVSENTTPEEADQIEAEQTETEAIVSENTVPENTVSENTVLENTVSENNVTDNTVSENSVSANTVSENTVSENTMPENVQEQGSTVSENSVTDSDMSLQERRQLNTSYIETQNVNQRDKQVIADNTIDFSDVTIACLGDSITEATNLEKLEDYQQYSYPTRLGEILGAEAVYNLGIGGSSIGRYWDKAFVDRYREIPKDTDIIVIMGGTNDGFCVSREELGTMEERKARTFVGDLDELMRGLKEDYPDALVVFVTPLPNVLHDVLRKERDYLLPQKELVDIIKLLAREHNFPVIDLYNSNILDSHDAAVIYNYMPDGVHGNEQGYQVLAEHIAAELIGLYAGQE